MVTLGAVGAPGDDGAVEPGVSVAGEAVALLLAFGPDVVALGVVPDGVGVVVGEVVGLAADGWGAAVASFLP